MSKNKAFCNELGLKTINFLYNNAYKVENYIVCGTRGWYVDEKLQNTANDVEYQKIVNREAQRLKMSLDEAKKLQENDEKILVFFHFPPVWADYSCEPIIEILKEYDIKRCYFGHIHGCYNVNGRFQHQGIDFNMISADYIDFIPLFIG